MFTTVSWSRVELKEMHLFVMQVSRLTERVREEKYIHSVSHYEHSFSSFNYVCSLPWFLDLLSSLFVIFCSLDVFIASLEKMMNPALGRERGKRRGWNSAQKSHGLEFAVRLAFKGFFKCCFAVFPNCAARIFQWVYTWLAGGVSIGSAPGASSQCNEQEQILL